MRTKLKNYVWLSAAILLTVGCTSTSDPRYKVSTIGNASRSSSAVVLSAEPVIIQRSPTGAGASAGGMLGAAAAAENSDNAAVIIAGLIGGAIIGSAVEGELGKSNGHQYVIQTTNEALISVAQMDAGNRIFSPGDRVILVYGHPHRLVLDPR